MDERDQHDLREREEQMRERLAGLAHLGKAVEGLLGVNYHNSATNAGTPGNERLSLANIDDAMHYQPWTPDQQEAGEIVREALTTAAKAILRHVPDGAFRSVALRDIINARMNANAGISFRGRF